MFSIEIFSVYDAQNESLPLSKMINHTINLHALLILLPSFSAKNCRSIHECNLQLLWKATPLLSNRSSVFGSDKLIKYTATATEHTRNDVSAVASDKFT